MKSIPNEVELLKLIEGSFEANMRIPAKEDFKKRLTEKQLLLRKINVLLLRDGAPFNEIPKNIQELIEFLETKTIEDLFPKLSDGLDEIKEEPILNWDYSLSQEVKGLIEEENYEEELQKQIMKIRALIIEKELSNEQYEFCRLFFTPERTLMTQDDLLIELASCDIDFSLIKEMSERFYYQKQYIGEVLICPICGKKWTDDHFDKFSLCKELSEELKKKTPLKKVFDESDVVCELNPETIKYTLIPNIGEILLKSRLEVMLKRLGVTFEIIMYPNFDEYDMIIKIDGKVFLIDVKDYQRPKKLATHFNERDDARYKLTNPNREDDVEGVFVVVMDYRVNIYGQTYISELRKSIDSKRIREQFISESELYEKIENYITKGA